MKPKPAAFQPLWGAGRALAWLYGAKSSLRLVQVTAEEDGLYYVWVREGAIKSVPTWTYAFRTKREALAQMRLTAGYAPQRVSGRLVPASRSE